MDATIKMQLPEDLQQAITHMARQAIKQALIEAKEKDGFPPYMTKQEASKYLHISGTTFDKWQRKLNIPLIQIDGVKRYKRETLDQFMKNIEQQNTK